MDRVWEQDIILTLALVNVQGVGAKHFANHYSGKFTWCESKSY